MKKFKFSKGKREEQEKEDRHKKLKSFLVGTGVYIVMVIGVIGSQIIQLSKDLTLSLQAIELSQMGGAAIVSILLYSKLEQSGDIDGKMNNVGRLLRNALYHGFFWMSIIGVWW